MNIPIVLGCYCDFLRYKRLRVLSVIAIVAISSCIPRQRGNEIEDAPKELRIAIVSGMSDTDRGRADLIYEVSSCVNGTAVGARADGQNFLFKSKDFKPNGNCSLVVKNFALGNDKTFHWATETGPGVLYQAKKVQITQAVDGRLVGSAVLQQLYSVANPSFEAMLLAEFPAPEPGRPVTAKLQCVPPFIANGTLLDMTGNSATFEFSGNLANDRDEYQCKTVIVWVNGEAKYSGFLGGGNPVPVVITKDAPKVKIGDTAVALAANVQPTADGIRVVTKPGGPCAAEEVFDIEAGRCVKR